MLIDCPGCAKSYHIIKAALGPNGRRVACPRCDTIWFVAAEGALASAKIKTMASRAQPIEIEAQDRRSVPHSAPSDGTIRRDKPAPMARTRGSSGVLRQMCAGAALLACGMATIGLRADIVRIWPESGAAYAALGLPVNLRGLELRGLHTAATRNGAEPVLGIEGEIANVRTRPTDVPPIALTIRDRDGHVLYSWTVMSQKRRLAAGETILFSARLAEPPAAAAEVVARFASETPETLASR